MYGRLVTLFICFAEISAVQQRPENSRIRGARVRHDAANTAMCSRRSCGIDQIEQKLSTLEQSMEKSQNNDHRLDNIERQTHEVKMALNQFRVEFGKLTEQPLSDSSKIPENDSKIDNISRGLKVVIAALSVMKKDLEDIKKNISAKSEKTVRPARNCKELLDRGVNVSGVYLIQPAGASFMALCEQEARGGGWTYIQNRHEGSQDFYLNWRSYKLGFGNLGGEFWLGLEYLHQLTGGFVNELLIEMVDLQERLVYAHYQAFSVGNEEEGYPLKVLGGYSGDAGDSLAYHAGSQFSTKDKDQDEWPEGSCAQAHTSGWWFKKCDNSNLNGRYLRGEVPEMFKYQGIYWGDFHGPQYSLLRVRMMVRPVHN